MQSGKFPLAGKKQLVRGFGTPQVVVMDVTETPIERPKHRQRQFYSGKKKRHTLKCQIVLELERGGMICMFFGKSRARKKLDLPNGCSSTTTAVSIATASR